MTCPRCRADGHPTPITDDRCPRCGTRWARGQVGQMVATAASSHHTTTPDKQRSEATT